MAMSVTRRDFLGLLGGVGAGAAAVALAGGALGAVGCAGRKRARRVRPAGTWAAPVRTGAQWSLIGHDGVPLSAARWDRIRAVAGGHAAMNLGGTPGPREGAAERVAGGKWGFLDGAGQVVVEPRFDEVGEFREGLAPVNVGATWDGYAFSNGGQWGLVDAQGRTVLEPRYGFLRSFHEGFAAVGVDVRPGRWTHPEGGRWGFVDRAGQVAIAPQYEWVGTFSEGLAAVFQPGSNGHVGGYIDRTGKLVIPIRFPECNGFVNGRARVYDGFQYRYIDRTGEPASAGFDVIDEFHEGLAAVKREGGHGFVDERGTIVIPLDYDRVWKFSEGRARVDRDGRLGFVDRRGRLAIPAKFADASDFHDGLVAVRVGGLPYYRGEPVGGRWRYATMDGTLVGPDDLDAARDFAGGLGAVGRRAVPLPDPLPEDAPLTWAFLDQDGRAAFGPYDALEDFGRVDVQAAR